MRFFLIRKRRQAKCSIGPGPKKGNPVFLCNKLPQKTIDITSQRWGGSGFRSALAGQCWRGVFLWRPSPRQSRCQQGCTWQSPWGGRTPCQQLTPQAGELVLADRGRLQFLSTWASPRTARASSCRGWVSTCAVHEGESGRGHPCPDPALVPSCLAAPSLAYIEGEGVRLHCLRRGGSKDFWLFENHYSIFGSILQGSSEDKAV